MQLPEDLSDAESELEEGGVARYRNSPFLDAVFHGDQDDSEHVECLLRGAVVRKRKSYIKFLK